MVVAGRLRDSNADIDLQWFTEPVEERLKTWGICCRKVGHGEADGGTALMSVVDGYPGEIHCRMAEAQE